MDCSAPGLQFALEECVLAFIAGAVRGEILSVGEAAAAAGITTLADDPKATKRAREQTPACAMSAEKHLVRAAAEWRVVAIGYQHCVERSTCTLRDLYYCGTKFFRSQNDATKALRSVCDALQVGRSVLGVHTTARALVCFPPSVTVARSADGQLLASGSPAIATAASVSSALGVDTAASMPSRIDVVPNWVGEQSIRLAGRPQLLLVVEKEAIFDRLVRDGTHARLDCAMVTGKGMPDLSARAAVWRLAKQFGCPVACLTDCNPAGLSIFLAYKLPCQSSTLPAADQARYCVSSLMWLGLHPSDLDTVAPESLMPLTPRDIVIANNLVRRTDISTAIADVAQAMLSRGDKAELESLYTTATGLKAVGIYVFRKLRHKHAIV